jgi:hypothetical protein
VRDLIAGAHSFALAGLLCLGVTATMSPAVLAAQGEARGDWSATAVLRGGIAGGLVGLGLAEVRAIVFDDRVQGDFGVGSFVPVLVPAGLGAVGGLFLERHYGPTVEQTGDMLLGAAVGAGVGALTGLITAAIRDDDPLDGFWSGFVVGTFVGSATSALVNRTRHATHASLGADSEWIAFAAGIPVLVTIAVGF